jgi:hypothetical protein
MPDKKLTDKDIVKDLECYRGQKLFAFNGKKPEIYIHDIIDLINRLQAENENLKLDIATLEAKNFVKDKLLEKAEIKLEEAEAELRKRGEQNAR